jgi:Uma2 family endonuclease
MTIITAADTVVEYTPEELLRLPDGDSYELVDGRLVEKHMGGKASNVGAEITGRLFEYKRQGHGGWILNADASYRCFPHRPRLVRKPDVSWIRPGRLADESMPDGIIDIAPDLAVEVTSPNDLYSEVDVKVGEYLDAGVLLVWIVNPATRTALTYHANGSVQRLREDDDLDGADVLPGFRCRLGDCFPPPAPPSAPT